MIINIGGFNSTSFLITNKLIRTTTIKKQPETATNKQFVTNYVY